MTTSVFTQMIFSLALIGGVSLLAITLFHLKRKNMPHK